MKSLAMMIRSSVTEDMHTFFGVMAQRHKGFPSTSHGETLAAMSGHEASVLVNVRLSEMLQKDKGPTLKQVAAIQEVGNPQLPIDDCGDCNDAYQLIPARSMVADALMELLTSGTSVAHNENTRHLEAFATEV